MASIEMAIIPVTIFKQNCTILWESETRRCVVTDPGGEPGRIIDFMNRMQLRPELILLTHGHLDHAGGAKALKGVFDEACAKAGVGPVPMLGPDARDQFLLDSIETQAAHFNIGGMRNVTPDRFVTESEVIEMGSMRFEVLHCPGHTPGHVVFLERAAKLALSGDVLFHNSVGRTDFDYGSHETLLESIRTKLLPLPDDIAILCGHGPTTTLGAERASNPFLQGL
jgi:glyoxylase-like metal-dependent hydrolase (beta-lactamase superfamily II)